MKDTDSLLVYSVVIPVYNAVGVLAQLSARIENVFSQTIQQPYEIIFVDDGSPNPATWPAVQREVAQNPMVRAIQLRRNFGQHAALLCGLAHAKGTYVITMDDDLQHAPEDIPTLLLQRTHAVVMGQFRTKEHTVLRNVLSRVKAYFDRILSGKPVGLRVSTFCVIQQSTLQRMLRVAQHHRPLLSSLVFAATRDVVGVAVSHSPRQEGASGYSVYKMGQLFFRLWLNHFSRFRDRFWRIGQGIAVLGGTGLLLLLTQKFIFQQVVSTGAAFVFGVLLFSGLVLLRSERYNRNRPSAPPYIIQCHIP